MQRALQLQQNGMRWVSIYWICPGGNSPQRCSSPASPLHRGLGADSSPGEWQLSLPVWYLFIGASWVLKSLLWRDETHARILRWDGSRAQPHLALFISLSFIYSLVLLYQKYNNNQRDRLNKQEPLPKVSIKIELNSLRRSNKQKSLLINFPFCLLFNFIKNILGPEVELSKSFGKDMHLHLN